MVQKNRWQLVPAILTLVLVACEDSITGIPEPVVEAAPEVEAVTSVAQLHDCGSPVDLILRWSGNGDYLDNAPPIVECVPAPQNIRWISDASGGRILRKADGIFPPGGTVGFETGHVGQAFRFTGVEGGNDQFLEIASTNNHLRPPTFTIDLWAQRLGPGQGFEGDGTNALIQKAMEDGFGDGISYFISWTGAGNIIAGVSFGDHPLTRYVLSKNEIGNGEWVHIALTVGAATLVQGATFTLYVNGEAQGSRTGPVNVAPHYGNGSVIIGNMWMQAREEGFHRTFDGCIDEIELFGRALEPGEIASIYDGGDDRTCPPVAPDNTAPEVDAGPDGKIDEGGTFSSGGSFTDTDADSWTATVNYGEPKPDGTEDVESLELRPGKTFDLSHTYFKDGVYTVTVKVTDEAGGEDSSTATVRVNNATPVLDFGTDNDATISAGVLFKPTVNFTDPGDASWDVTVNYGDGSDVEPFSVSATSFDLSHPYTSEQCGPFTVTVTVTDDDGAKDSSTAQVTVEYEYELSVNKTTVRVDRRHRSNRDRYDVDGRIPSSVLDCFNSDTDALTVSFGGGVPQDFAPGSFVRKDDKWQYKAPRGAQGIRKFDLHDDGRFKIQARYMDLTSVHFPGYVPFSLSIGPASADMELELDERGRLRRARGRGREKIKQFLSRWRKH